jgi:hypothetical protein
MGIEVIGQGSHASPVHKRPRPSDHREPLSYLLDKLRWALRSGQFHPQTSFGGCVAGTDFYQQFGQSLRAEGFEIFRVKGCFRGHSFYSCWSVNNSLLFSTVPVKREIGAAVGRRPRQLDSPQYGGSVRRQEQKRVSRCPKLRDGQ